ncbi:hypothetical protein BX661DRAFT_26654 [Kickxella alabastrina]|uniref:uncharacterized protein n=1 Tax=Kickxella alabastrina TaxID=61397 RepID=UPI0022201E06|nr:uncharacterized protein BX661DRAFT_26654 [Kickxella alabastrina]KAI7827368.1 hypothetical protein BX661DRAFT_26654 [Kickxella alabastrina]
MPFILLTLKHVLLTFTFTPSIPPLRHSTTSFTQHYSGFILNTRFPVFCFFLRLLERRTCFQPDFIYFWKSNCKPKPKMSGAHCLLSVAHWTANGRARSIGDHCHNQCLSCAKAKWAEPLSVRRVLGFLEFS